MRCILGFCAILAAATPVLAQNNVPIPGAFSQQPTVSTSVPNIHATGANQVTTSNVMQQGMVAGQPAATVPSGNMTYYYYYPAGNSGYAYQTSPATVYSGNTAPAYTVPTQYYYTTARRGFPFGLFRRRYVQTAYTTAYTTTPTYYTSPSYYYVPTAYTMPTTYGTPMTYTVPATTSATMPMTGTTVPNTAAGTTSPTYTPTTYNVPTETVPSGTPIPSRTIPVPPPVNPR